MESEGHYRKVEPTPERFDDGAKDLGNEEDCNESEEETAKSHGSADHLPEDDDNGCAKHGETDDFQPVTHRFRIGDRERWWLRRRLRAGCQSEE